MSVQDIFPTSTSIKITTGRNENHWAINIVMPDEYIDKMFNDYDINNPVGIFIETIFGIFHFRMICRNNKYFQGFCKETNERVVFTKESEYGDIILIPNALTCI